MKKILKNIWNFLESVSEARFEMYRKQGFKNYY
jgi:hypothetical protein